MNNMMYHREKQRNIWFIFPKYDGWLLSISPVTYCLSHNACVSHLEQNTKQPFVTSFKTIKASTSFETSVEI